MANEFEPTSKSLVDWLSERANRNGDRVNQLEISKLAKVWIDPDICNPPYTFANGYGQYGNPEELFKYRLFAVDTLQVIGTLSPGTSGLVAFTLLPPFWPDKNIHFVGTVLTSTLKLARFDVNSTNGQVTVTYT